MAAYYNEIDPYCVEWLRNLMAAGHIPAGDVDDRPIQEVRPDDLRGYDHCHFFAGLGGWALAARLADYPEDRPLWTGSCPCQPFSVAGKRKAAADDRHLWPYWFPLIRECRPPVVFGEQVESKDGYEWLAGVQTDLEGASYAVAAACLPAACVASPQGRHRLWFVAYSDRGRRGQEWVAGVGQALDGWRNTAGTSSTATNPGVGGVAYPLPARWPERGTVTGNRPLAGSSRPCGGGVAHSTSGRGGEAARLVQAGQKGPADTRSDDAREHAQGSSRRGWCGGGVANGECPGLEIGAGEPGDHGTQFPATQRGGGMGYAECAGDADTGPEAAARASAGVQGEDRERQRLWADPWQSGDVDWLHCAFDGKLRRVKPGVRLLADGVPARVAKLRALGNAIVPQVAAEFIRAAL